ncbi:hypothetical protein [Nocardia vinacea]|uniref:hypothetical protein n=1 Tax=Nocardia vinacea TaxID=96468 RepID=UPI0002D90B7D|nr:hypothetical protein [Nocardia vinacea]
MTAEKSPADQRHAGELPSIREWLCAIENAAGLGYHVEREPNPPFGWNLVDGSGAIVCSGPLDRLDRWLLRGNFESSASAGAAGSVLPQRVPGASGHFPAGPARLLPVEVMARFTAAVTEWATEPPDASSA